MSEIVLPLKEERRPIYSGTPDNFHWAGFGSGKGSNLETLATIQPPSLVFSDNPDAELFVQPHLTGVEKIVLDGKSLVGKRPSREKSPGPFLEWEKRSEEYNRKIGVALEEFQQRKGYAIDLIVLGGYMRLIREPLLTSFKDRMINVHPGDLALLDGKKRILIGDHAVYAAFRMGQTYTRSSVIIVDSGIDHGEILSQGPVVNIEYPIFYSSMDQLKEAAAAHQQRQKTASDHPALVKAFKVIRGGKLSIGSTKPFLGEWRKLYLDGVPLPYTGCEAKGNEVQ